MGVEPQPLQPLQPHSPPQPTALPAQPFPHLPGRPPAGTAHHQCAPCPPQPHPDASCDGAEVMHFSVGYFFFLIPPPGQVSSLFLPHCPSHLAASSAVPSAPHTRPGRAARGEPRRGRCSYSPLQGERPPVGSSGTAPSRGHAATGRTDFNGILIENISRLLPPQPQTRPPAHMATCVTRGEDDSEAGGARDADGTG